MNANTEISNKVFAAVISVCLAAVAVAALTVTHLTSGAPFVLF